MIQSRIRTAFTRKTKASQLILAVLVPAALGAGAAAPAELAAKVDQESEMTATNTQVIDTIYEGFAKGDLESVLSVMDENVVWLHPGSKDDIPFAGEFTGRGGVQEFFTIAFSSIDVLEQDVFSTVSEGDQVLVLGREHMRVKATGKEYDSNWIHAYTIHDGKVVRFEEYIDTAQLKDAFAQN